MLLKKLIFNNYKTFYGHQEINFYIPKEVREEQKKNIILIGGLNGAGKTTILKAILYVLFGKRGVTEQEHKRLFSNVINNTFFDEGGKECSLTLTLETDSGEEWDLKTKWNFDQNKVLTHETREITVRKPGVRVGKHAIIGSIEAYNRFIDKMIPYHAAPFFIFDGEEIKEIILRQNSAEMKEAIHKISGMEAYKQLVDDLSSIKASIEQSLAKSVKKNKSNDVNDELLDTEDQINTLEIKRGEMLNDKKKLEQLISDIKKIRNEKLTQNSISRETIIKKQTQYETQLQLKKGEFRSYFNNYSVQIILANKITELKQRLKTENEFRQRISAHESALVPYQNFINQLLSCTITPPLSEDQLHQLKQLGKEIWIKENKISHDRTTVVEEILHDLNNQDYNYLINLPVEDSKKAVNIINQIESIDNQLSAIESQLRSAPRSVNIDQENDQIDIQTKKAGEIDLRLKTIQSKLNKLKESKASLLNQLTRLTDQDEDYDVLISKHTNIEKVMKAMEQYIYQMTTMKAEFIREEFANMLTKLFRKQDEFGKIEFDVNTYTIRLYNDRGQEISIQDRSAGEMQMIASALIWALTKASDLSMPMVIDTPLGRLDSHHRNHLINHYYKELSEQVIILSTDTEITEDYVSFMSNNSYRQYMLDYDETKKYTIIRDGYFDFVKE